MRKAVLSLLVFTTFLVLYALNDQPLPNKGTASSSSNDLDYCGSNLAWQRLMEQQPDLLLLQESLEEAYYQDQQTASLKTAAPPYTIPVVFHIIHQGGTENIPATSIQLSLDHLNQSFANAGPYDPSTGVATNIDFCLAKRKPDGSLSSGIERVSDPLTALNMSDDLALKNLSRYDPTQYLNIWVVDEICSSTSCGVAGYAYFPSAHGGNVDGIVVEARWLGNSPANSSVLTHEVGHYLGLYHTFEGGCQNDDCLANGDRVCDTPPDQSTAAVPCNASPNSCTTDTNDGFATDQPDMFQNYMDYGDWGCYSMFTPGQRDRMHFFLDGIRASLQSSQGCLDPCTSPPSVSITNDFSTTVAQGATINLTADGVNADTYTWYLDGTAIGTGNPLPYIFTAEGSYNVSVQVGNSDPNCQADAQSLVLVRCPVQASFSPSSYAVTPGSVIFFTDASTNANSYEWFVDGTSEATSTGFFYQFDNLGTYTVSLEASNGDCSDEFSVVITVGTQGSSQAGLPVWPMQGGSNGGFHTVDWRTDPPTTGTVGPISDVGGGGTGAAFNSCGSVIFFAAHTAQSTPNQLFIYRPDGTPLLDASTANGPGLNAVRGPTELQVIPVPTTQDEWYLIYREYGSDSGAPANNASYSPLRLMYSRVKLEADGQLTVVVRDQVLNAGANSYTYNDGMAVSRTINGDPTRQYLYAGRHALNQSSISVDRFIISNTGISWQENTGDIPTGGYWVLTHAGSYIELSPTEDRVVVGNRNQFTNYVDFIILETADFNAASATTLMGEDLILVADGQTQDATSILPINQRIDDLGTNNSYPLLFLRNFQKKLSGVEFSPNGRFLYLTSGGYVSSGYTNLTYLAQVDLESDPLEVRLQIQDTPTPYNTTTGLGCTFSSCGEEWEAIGGVESSFDGNLYFSKRIGNQLFVIPNPNNFMPQRLVPGSIDLATPEEPNVQVIGGPGSLVDQIDGFNYLSSQSQTVNLSVFGLDCAGDCRTPFEVEISSNDGSYQETFTIVACPTIIPVCADTSLSYRIVDLELGIEYPNAILNGEVNAPLGSDRFEFSEPQGCPEDCDEPYVYFYGEDADYSGRTLLAYNDFIFVGGQRGDEAMLTKLTSAGDVVWAQTMQLLNDLPNVIVDLKIDSEGMLIGAGSGRLGNNIASFTFKINPDNGATIWTRTYSDPASDYFSVSDIFESPTNGDYIVLGTAFSNSNGLGCDAAFYSIDRNDGDITSQRIHFHLGSCEGIESAVISNNSFFVTGRYNFSGGGFNRMRPAISSFNSTGTPLWSRLYLVDVNQDARLYSSDISLNGPNNLAILAHGDDNGIAADNNDFWIISARIINGGIEVATKYTLPEPINGKEILAINGSYVVLAQARNSNNLYLTRISSLGDVIWAKQLQNLTSTGSGDEVIQIGDYLYLTAQHTGNANTEMALLRIDLETGEFPDGCISNEDVTVTRQAIPFPYGGFNSLSPYDTQVDGSSDFDLSPTLLAPLPISCAPPCGPENCTNGIDDDGDGLADCEDPDCDCEDDCEDQNYVSVFGEENEDEQGFTVLSLPNGNVLVGAGGPNYINLLEVSPEGTLVQEKRFTLPDRGIITDLFLDSEGMLIGSGRSGTIAQTVRGFAFRYDYVNQSMFWFNLALPGLTNYSIIEPVSGGDILYIGNHLQAPAPGFGDDITWLSLDRNTGVETGNISSNFNQGGPETFFQTIAYSNKLYHAGRVANSSSPSTFRASVSRFNLNGQEEWTRMLHVSNNSSARLYGFDIDVFNDELYIISSGDDNGSSFVNTEVFLYKMSTSGELIWTKKYDLQGYDNEWAHEMIVLPDGLLIYGAEQGVGSDLFLMKVNFEGDLVWSKRFLSPEPETLNFNTTQQITRAGSSIYFTATTESFGNNNGQDVLLVRTNLDGEVNEDCFPYSEIEIVVTTIQNGVSTPITLSSYPSTLNLSLINPNESDTMLPSLSSCLTACEEICDNGTDDDGDGLIDCDDPDLADDCCCYVPPVLDLGEDIIVCENGVIVLDAGPDFTSYLWSDLTTEQTLTTTFPGEYSVTATDQCGNTQSDTILITVDPASEIDLGPDVMLCPGETLTLTVDGFESYEWFPAGSFDCNTCPTVVFTASVDTEIIVVGTNAAGCISTDTLMVTIAGTQPGSYTAAGLCPGESITFGDLTITDAGLYLDTVSTGTCLTIDSLEVTLLEAFNTTEDRAICAGQTTTIFGNEETEAGTYEMTFTAENGCDSTHTLVLSVLDTFETSEIITICEGESATIFGEQQTTADEYSMSFTAENGCDSTHTITLEVLETFATSEMLSVCAGNAVEIFGNDETEAGDYSMTFTAENGCDSTHTVTLTVLETVETEETITICDGETEAIFGEETGIAGTYSMTFVGQNDCDSTHTITLEVLDTFTTDEDISTCEGTPVDVFGTPTSEAGTYTMTFAAENGCDSTHTINLTVLPTFNTSASVGICPGESTDVFGETVEEAGEYSMTFTAENGCDSVHIITVIQLESFSTTETIDDLCEGDSVEIFGETVTESGMYQQTFTAENGCDSLHTITVNFLPTTTTTEELFICEGESIEIFGQQISVPGTYQETYTGSNGCDSTYVITLTEETFSGSAYIFPPCPSDPESWIVYISTNGNGGPYTVSWNGTVVVGSTINNIPVGDHTAIVTSANGCMYTVDFTIRPYNQPWWGLVAGPSCNDPQSGEIRIQTEPTDETLTFSLDGITFSETPILDGLTEGNYTLYVKYGDRCVVTEPITVPGPETFSLALPEDQTIKWGESLPIDPTTDVSPGATYQWTPAGSLDCPDCEKVIAQPEETTRYFLKVTDENGCTEVDDILVKVDRRIPYYVPNAFTPNNDGKNDYFTVYAATGVEEVQQMIIFDRWGGEVFVRNNFPPNREELGWDGRSRKQQVTPGVYVYYLELRLSTGEVVMVKGDVTLIR
ncbi:MAG: M43 family zinc metalloprotease [Lewinella sp.]|uniref:M43 family zinc metalloprotease n=1 Tax=Lewinella sp. TaxID=2004506 RepID=UPI003D6C1DCE